MQRIDADAAGGAAPESETARVQAGRIGDQRERTGAIVRVSGPPGNPPSEDADLPQFLRLQAAAARDGWDLLRVVSEGAPVYLLCRLRYSEAFHDLTELRQFLVARGVRS